MSSNMNQDQKPVAYAVMVWEYYSAIPGDSRGPFRSKLFWDLEQAELGARELERRGGCDTKIVPLYDKILNDDQKAAVTITIRVLNDPRYPVPDTVAALKTLLYSI
jgi:hypothetical protein